MRPSRRSLLTLSSLALLLVAGAAPAGAASPTPAAVPPSASGWVVVRKPTLAAYVPDPRDRGNSTGGTVTVIRETKGRWTVAWAGLAAAGLGDLQVTALGPSARHCVAYTWGTNGSSAYASISCFQRTTDILAQYGKLVDVPFVAAIVGEDSPVVGTQGRLAYAWMNLPTTDGTPDPSYNYVNSGGQLTVQHTAVGGYTVTVPGVAKADGVLLVTGYTGQLRDCQVRTWFNFGSDLRAMVDCADFLGAKADADFDLLYLRHIGLEGYGGAPAASLWADKPTAASYHPNPGYAWSSAGMRATIRRTSKGVYSVTLPGMPKGGAAIVSAYGQRNHMRQCQLGAIRTTGTPQQVQVRCFTYAGAPADSQFVLSYTK